MNTQCIKEKFDKIGARVRFSELTARRDVDVSSSVVVDVLSDKKGQIYDIGTKGNVEISVLDVQVRDRHLLLMAKIISGDQSAERDIVKTLCGHDEREFFAAQVPTGKVSNVLTAKQALKPALAVFSQKRHRVKNKHLNSRKNKGFVRQGEWFFVPAGDLKVNEAMILRPKGGEPLVLAGARGGNKPHRAQEAHIAGGIRVYVTNAPLSANVSRQERQRLSAGLTEGEMAQFINRYPKAKTWNWATMTRNPDLYVRGWIRHPDHKTILLKEWHRVAVNAEIRGRNVAFLD